MSSSSVFASEVDASFVRGVCRCDSYAKIASEILKPVADRLRATSAVFFQFAMSQGRPVVIEQMRQYGGFNRLIHEYSRQLYRSDPLFLAESDNPTTLRDITQKTRRSPVSDQYTPYFSALSQGGIGDIIGVYHKGRNLTGERTFHLSFQRDRTLGDYNREELSTLCYLSPILQAVLSKLAYADDVQQLDAALAAISAEQKTDFELVNNRSDTSHAWMHGKSNTFETRAVTEGFPLHAAGLPSHMTLVAKDRHEAMNLAAFGLTDRELQVVQALRAGHSNLSSATKLGISIRTVENHIRSIFSKVGVNSRTQLLAKLTA
jgi:DNA-binding CsgD family transcriptional regulator